ncbi:polysaccharide biosynthesis tyrosine autokinase [Reichenbachiella sp. MALMAid0571]|uniref:polysaccharide biosynthesis tyrosine autokinase n=1 Tax=Reichenbachiella sp. MALMAid0571 TaxID=3143939 RepID=UPI0032E0016C
MQKPHNQNDDGNPLNDIDLDKIYHVLKRSIPWIVLLLLITNIIAYLYVRYTQQIFQSESVLKLDIKNEADLLGLQNPITPDIKGISGEMELLKSRLFFGRVADAIGLDVSYYHPGRSHIFSQIVDERYNNSPFAVSYKLKNNSFYDRKFDLEILDENNFSLKYDVNGEKIELTKKFGEKISNDHFNFLIEKTSSFNTSSTEKDYYFTINSRESLINYLASNVTVQPENFSANTIKISLKHSNKHKVRDIVHAIDTLYLEYTTEAKNQAIKQKIEFLDDQLLKTTEELSRYEQYFENFTIKNRTTDLSRDLAQTISMLNALDSQRYNLRNRLSNVNMILKQIEAEKSLLINPRMITGLPGFISQSISNYNDLVSERELKLASYNDNTFVIQRIDKELDVARKRAIEQINEYQKNLVESVEEQNRRRKMLEGNFVELPSMGTDYNKNKRFYSLQEEYYLSIIKTKMELEIARAGTVTNFVILSPASFPTEPIEPQKALIHGVGFVSGLILSIFFVAIRYLLHNKISSHKELENLINIPMLGIVPFYNKEKLNVTQLVVDKNPKSAISESIRSIRTNMDFLIPGKGKKIISITSTVSGEGKTFIAVNLGAILALSHSKIVVVDLDMRKPKVHLALNQEKGDKGVSTILIGKHSIEESVNTTNIENLSFITAGPTPPNPSELILSDKFGQFLEDLKNTFDVVILDTPPVGLVTDGILVMKHADLPIYVLRADYSKRSYAKSVNSLSMNNKFKNLTAILNSVKSNKNQGYGYGYGYGYGQGYYDEDS